MVMIFARNGSSPDENYMSKETINPFSCQLLVFQGDSGGPLIIDERVIGILSFGRQGCPDAINYPEVFTRVEPFISWINYIMKKDQEGEFKKYQKKPHSLWSSLPNSFANIFHSNDNQRKI